MPEPGLGTPSGSWFFKAPDADSSKIPDLDSSSAFGYCYHNFGKQYVLSFSVFICFMLTASVIITEGAGIMHA